MIVMCASLIGLIDSLVTHTLTGFLPSLAGSEHGIFSLPFRTESAWKGYYYKN